jgi:uncharacterized protein (DUF1499 family)
MPETTIRGQSPGWRGAGVAHRDGVVDPISGLRLAAEGDCRYLLQSCGSAKWFCDVKTLAVVVLLLVAAGFGGLFYMGQKSRSGDAPGLQAGQLLACPSSPNCVSSESNSPGESRVEALPVDAWDRIPATIEAMGGTVTRQEPRYIAAEFTSSLFGFTDDLEFRLAEDAVHLRSASRVGHSDMGVNRARVRALRERLAGQ